MSELLAMLLQEIHIQITCRFDPVFVRFDGEHMVLTQKPRLWQGVMQHRELHWERVADAPAN